MKKKKDIQMNSSKWKDSTTYERALTSVRVKNIEIESDTSNNFKTECRNEKTVQHMKEHWPEYVRKSLKSKVTRWTISKQNAECKNNEHKFTWQRTHCKISVNSAHISDQITIFFIKKKNSHKHWTWKSRWIWDMWYIT